MLVLQGKQLIVFIYYYIFRNGHRKKDVCWRRTECFWVDHQLAAPPLVIRKYGSVFPLWLFLHSSFLFMFSQFKLVFLTAHQDKLQPSSGPLHFIKKFLGKSDGMKTSCFHIYGDALSFRTTWGASSPRPVFASCLHWICISYWVLRKLSPFFIFFPMSLFLSPHPSGMVNLRAN